MTETGCHSAHSFYGSTVTRREGATTPWWWWYLSGVLLFAIQAPLMWAFYSESARTLHLVAALVATVLLVVGIVLTARAFLRTRRRE